MKDMHPFVDYIFGQYTEFDRSVMGSLPGAKCYIRYTANGEFPQETLPFEMTIVQRASSRARMRRSYCGLLPMPFSGKKPQPPVIPGPIEGCVYVVKRRDEYKLGRTTKLHERLDQLEKTFAIEGLCHYILTDNSKRLEKIIHRAFAPVRMSGEWFRLRSEHLDFLRMITCVFVDHTIFDLEQYEDQNSLFPLSPGANRIKDLPLIDSEREKGIQEFWPVERYVPEGWPQIWFPSEDELSTIAHVSPSERMILFNALESLEKHEDGA